MKKKLYKVSFFLLLIALFTFLEWQIDKEVEKIAREVISDKYN